MIVPDSQNYILNENMQEVLNTNGIQDPLRDGAYNMTQSGTESRLDVVSSDNKISTYQNAKEQTMNIIKSIINYAL